MIDTYLLGTGEASDPTALAALCAGTRLDLRPGRWRRVEARAPDGRTLGYLPPDDALAVTPLLEVGAPAVARVTAVVPAFRRARVQLAIEVEPAAAGDRGG